MDEMFKRENLLKQKIKFIVSEYSGEAVKPLHMDK
jgi:hypothetical protein